MEMVEGKKIGGKKIAPRPSNVAMKTARHRLLPLAMLLCASPLAWAQAFTFEIASPVAAQDFRVKSAAFVFRTTGCPEAEKVEVSATGQSLAGTERKSVVLKVVASSKPGVYAVLQQWETGQWIVILKGSCGQAQAGAIIPVGPHGFVREASKFYSRPPAAAEIDAAIKAIPPGGYK
ncbi:MAG TPA: hypothetical protein VGG94_04500 [Chthoniobacterales bacterium]